MQDTCRILAYSASSDGYGNPDPSYTPGAATPCGVEHVDPREVAGTGEVPLIDARIRLPLETALDERDRIQVTHRYGEELTSAQVFEIAGPVKRGPSGLVVEARLADDV